VTSDEFYWNAQTWGAATQVMHAYLVGQDAKDWPSGVPITDLARGGGIEDPRGGLTVHHIFPRKIMAESESDPDAVNCPANYALLSGTTNSKFKDTPQWR
jgi:hypothetical protein